MNNNLKLENFKVYEVNELIEAGYKFARLASNRKFDKNALTAKKKSLKSKGLLQPAIVVPAQWAIDEAAEVGVNLEYFVPQEGSNVWFDGWCIPIYAKNTKAASYFINYMCMPENAILNMEEIGYVSVIASPEILDWANDEEVETTSNLTYFFGEGAESVKLNPVQYPDKAVIERCEMMHDSGARTPKMLEMWARVKGDNVPLWNLIIIITTFGVLFIIGIRRKILKARKKSHRTLRKGKRK
jgi:spermidine/putrescine transport system substrate-binding protein